MNSENSGNVAKEGASCAALLALQETLDRLIAPDGCPWDREQTPASLADYLIEESCELAAAIRSGDAAEARGEMGDLLFLILFVARLYEREGAFSLADALADSREKMVRRHPHVFGDAHFASQDEHLRNWERIKREERAGRGGHC